MILLLQLDGKMPNLALMRVAAHHRRIGDAVTLRRAGNVAALEPRLDDPPWSRVYASAIFARSAALVRRVRELHPHALVGGTGVDLTTTLEQHGIDADTRPDYSDYPRWRTSIGFSQRGCRLSCGFCVVPRKEGKVAPAQTIGDIWRGDPWPREVVLLDNDFFGSPVWRDRIDEIRAGAFKVCFSQGINARLLSNEAAAAIASVDYRADNMRTRRIYTAWDSRDDERPLFRGLDALVRHGVKPREIMVYVLIGYDGDTPEGREYRRARLREYGAVPYPMPYVRTPELLGFQRWVIGAYDKRVPWSAMVGARFSPRRLGDRVSLPLFHDDFGDDQ